MKMPPPILMIIGLGVEAVLAIYVPIYQLAWPALVRVGAVLIGLAFVLALAAILRFRKAHTTVLPHGTPTQFVANGPYRFTRNPMYLSLLTILVGTVCIFGAVSTLIVPVLFVVLIDKLFIAREEKMLLEKFGEEYAAYLKRVRRWI